MHILITGGTGFLGSALSKSLQSQGFTITVLSRQPETVAKYCGSDVNAIASLAEITRESRFNVIINLAGAPIFGGRWTDARKQLIRDSRISLTNELIASIDRMQTKPELLISGSAIGIYGNQGKTVLTEQSEQLPNFSQQLCHDWEQSALKAEQLGVRVCLIRTGLVIGHNGGFLQRMLLPFRLGLGGTLGNGQQWMSWIHRNDWIKIVHAMIANPRMSGPYNATAPNPVSNSEFTKTLASTLHRPTLLPLPAWLLKILLGEMSELVLDSQRVIPDRLIAKGFYFQFNHLVDAISEALAIHDD